MWSPGDRWRRANSPRPGEGMPLRDLRLRRIAYRLESLGACRTDADPAQLRSTSQAGGNLTRNIAGQRTEAHAASRSSLVALITECARQRHSCASPRKSKQRHHEQGHPHRRVSGVREGRCADRYEEETDAGVHDKRLLVIESEFVSPLRVMERNGNTLSPTVRNLWDRGDVGTLTRNSGGAARRARAAVVGRAARRA